MATTSDCVFVQNSYSLFRDLILFSMAIIIITLFNNLCKTLRFHVRRHNSVVAQAATKNRFPARNVWEIITFAVMQFADNWYVSIRDSREIIKWPNIKTSITVGFERRKSERITNNATDLQLNRNCFWLNLISFYLTGMFTADWVGLGRDNDSIRLAACEKGHKVVH